MKKYFNKNLIMGEEKEHLFQQSNICWICKKFIDHDDEKLQIIVTYLENLEEQHIGVITLIFN